MIVGGKKRTRPQKTSATFPPLSHPKYFIMDDFDKEALLKLLTNIETNRVPSESTNVSSLECLITDINILRDICTSGTIRDISWTPVLYRKLFTLLHDTMDSDDRLSLPVSAKRQLFEIITNIFSTPEFLEGFILSNSRNNDSEDTIETETETENFNDSNTTNTDLLHTLYTPLIDRTFIDALLYQLVARSRGTVEKESLKRDSLGLVTWVTNSTSSSVEGGGARSVGLQTTLKHNNLTTKKEGTENSDSAANSSSNTGVSSLSGTKSSSISSSSNFGNKLDENLFFRSLLYWIYVHFPMNRTVILDQCEAYLRSFGLDPDPEAASATNIILQFLYKIVEGEKRIIAQSRIPYGIETLLPQQQQRYSSSVLLSPNEPVSSIITKGRYLTNLTTASHFLSSLMPLHNLSGMLSDISANLSLYHEALTKLLCIVITVYPSLLDTIVDRLLRIWREDCRAVGNTAKGILILHEIYVILSECGINEVYEYSEEDKHAKILGEGLSSTDSTPKAPTPVRTLSGHQHTHHPFSNALGLILHAVEESIGSDNSREAQIALSFFKQSSIIHAALTSKRFDALLKVLLRGNVTNAFNTLNSSHNTNLHWNATVNKMTASAVRSLLAADKQRVLDAYDQISRSSKSNTEDNIARTVKPAFVPPIKQIQMDNNLYRGNTKGNYYGQPPVTITGVAPWAVKTNTKGGQPPVTITGVAPWAVKTTETSSVMTTNSTSTTSTGIGLRSNSILPSSSRSMSLPIVTNENDTSRTDDKTLSLTTTVVVSSDSPPSVVSSFSEQSSSSREEKLAELLKTLETYLTKLSPSDDANSLTFNSNIYTSPSSLLAQPVLLPTLAFHDLVFGKVLGEGSFSTVTYARQIIKGKPASTWPEYAVKAVSTAILHDLGYEHAVRREMAVLSSLIHPSVCRLVSAFRWRAGAFLVLEYASGGDLQGTLAKLGSLDEKSAKLLFLEIGYALHTIHQKGFAYGDCKPENIVLVTCSDHSVHAKLTDFAACRPITDEGTNLIKDSRHILRNLRDGDWRVSRGLQIAEVPTVDSSGTSHSRTNTVPLSTADGDGIDILDNNGTDGSDIDDKEEEEDNRIEGTEAYLSPELASRQYNSRPTICSDAYAFGVTLFQCLAGYLPDTDAIWREYQQQMQNNTSITGTDSESVSMDTNSSNHPNNKIVRFGGSSGGKKNKSSFPNDFPPSARDLVCRLLHLDPLLRLGGGIRGFLDILDHPWFRSFVYSSNSIAVVGTMPSTASKVSDDNNNLHDFIIDLYSKPGAVLAQGTAGPSPDPAWTRRHNSSIWAPLPQYVTKPPSASNLSPSLTTSESIKYNDFNPFAIAMKFTMIDIMRIESMMMLPVLPPVDDVS